MLPPELKIRDAYAHGMDAEQKFIQNLALFLATFLKEHGTLVEVDVSEDGPNQNAIAEAHSLVGINIVYT